MFETVFLVEIFKPNPLVMVLSFVAMYFFMPIMSKKIEIRLNKDEINNIIELAWSDNVPFESIKEQFGCPENEVIKIMRKYLKRQSFDLWRKRVKGRKTKHRKINKNSQ